MKIFIKTLVSVSLLSLVVAIASGANEQSIAWDKSPTGVLVQSRCSICHSLDYILMNAGFLKPTGWEAEVTKMRKAYGAPVSDEEAKEITAYLNQQFGAGN